MRMKYYLRGMGIGVMGTVLIFMVALIFYKPNLSDDDVIKRAEALGMVMADDKGTISEAQSAEDESDDVLHFGDDEAAPADTEVAANDTDANSDTASSDAAPQMTNKPEYTVPLSEDVEDANATTASDNGSSGNVASADSSSSASQNAGKITIAGGESSETISQKLYKADLIDNADDFNSYLVSHGYDRTLQNGEFSIPEGSTYEDISKIITGKN